MKTRLSIISSIHTTVRHQSPNLWDLSIQLCKHNNITVTWHGTTLKEISLLMLQQEFHAVLNGVEFLLYNFLLNLYKSNFTNEIVNILTTAMKLKSFPSETHFRLFHLIDLSYDCASHVNNFQCILCISLLRTCIKFYFSKSLFTKVSNLILRRLEFRVAKCQLNKEI